MRLFEMFEEKIDEVNMSPGALADFAKTEFAQSMTAGFETELIVPDNGAEAISIHIADAIGMPVKYKKGYHGVKRGTGYFILEPDSSIGYNNKEDEDTMGDNEIGLELVSPPMPFAQTLEYLDKVFSWANSYGCRADSTTGFHMGISIPNQNKNNVDYLKFILFLGDEYVLNEFGRGDNEYAQALSSILVGNLSYDFKRTLAKVRAGMNSKAARTLTKNLGSSHNGKYVSVNIKPNYIEVRSAGGEDYIKNVDKIKLTLMRYVRAMALAADPEAEKNEYAKKFYKFLNRSSHFPREENAIMQLFVQYSTGQMSAEELTQKILTIRQHKVANTFNSLKKVPTPQTGQGTEYLVLDDEGKLLHKLSAYSRKDAEKLAIKWARSENYPVSVYDMRVVLPNSKIGQAALAKPADQKQNIKHVKAYRVSFMLDGENFKKTVQIASEDEVYDWFAKNMPDAEIEHLQPIYHQ